MKTADVSSADLVIAFNGHGIFMRGVCGGATLAIAVSIPSISWIASSLATDSTVDEDGYRTGPSLPPASLAFLALCALFFVSSVYVARNMANTQRCVVTATALEHSVTRWSKYTTKVPLDAIEQVDVRTNCNDQRFGIVNVVIETAASLETDSDGDKRASAAVLIGVLDAENVQRAILARRDALRQRASTANTTHHVVINLTPSVALTLVGQTQQE